MGLENVYGKLGDAAGNIDQAEHLRIKFALNGAAVGGNGIIHSSPVYVDEFVGPDREWTVKLEATSALFLTTGGDVFYVVTVERRVAGNGGFATDAAGWKLRVPTGGGAFTKLVRGATNPAGVWFDPSPPTDPTEYTGWVPTNVFPPKYYEYRE